MRPTLRGLVTLSFVGTLVLANPSAPRADERTLEQLRTLSATHPDDPDLRWALVGALEQAGEIEAAVESLASFVARWPRLHPRARLRLGRLLYQAGRHTAALRELEGGLAENPINGPAHLYRGLALRELGRIDESSRALAMAARLEPELVSESLLLQALNHLDASDERQAQALLRRLLELDPPDNVARDVELILGARQGSNPSPDRLTLAAYSGAEVDSNVTLEGDQPGTGTNRRDSRLSWGGVVSLRAAQGERTKLTLGYRYDESAHQDLKRFDVQSHRVFATSSYNASDRVTLGLDASASGSQLDGSRYLSSFSGRQSVLIQIGERAGVSRGFVELSRTRFHDRPLLPSLERGGTTYALGLDHYAPIPGWANAWGSVGVRLARTRTRASRDLLGFAGAYDRKSQEGSLRLHFPAAWKLDVDVSASYSRERYDHHNVVELLASGSGATRRNDRILATTLSIQRPLTRLTRIELRWRGTRQHSNLNTYQYDRSVAGLYFTIRSS